MSRHVYSLTDETRKVLTDNVKIKDIAKEMHCDESYLYQILSQVETDCFAKIERIAAAVTRAGGDITPWISSLRAIRLRNERLQPLNSHQEAARLASEAADVSAAFIEHKDPETKLREVREEIAQARRVERALLEEISPTRTLAAVAVNGHRNGGRR